MDQSSSFSKEQYERRIEQLKPDECRVEHCFFQKYLANRHNDMFTMVQMKCIEKLKWEQSERERRDIGWNDAGLLWVDRGFAKRFREVYNEELTVKEIYARAVKNDSSKPIEPPTT